MVSSSPCGSPAAERSVLPSTLRVPPMTGEPDAFWLAASQDTVWGSKLAGVKRSLPVVPEGFGDVLLLPEAATATAAKATTPTRLVMPRGDLPIPRPSTLRTVIETSL